MTPSCDDLRPLFFDHVDGLLDEADAKRIEAHVAGCASCAAGLERARRMSAAIAAPWAVAGPAADLPMRALARRASRPAVDPAPAVGSRGPRAAVVALRYALTFAAGIVVALLVRANADARPALPDSAGPAPVAAPAAASDGGHSAGDEMPADSVASSPRRIV